MKRKNIAVGLILLGLCAIGLIFGNTVNAQLDLEIDLPPCEEVEVTNITVVDSGFSEIYEYNIDGINTLTVCQHEDSSNCITMMDRNLGATTNDINNTSSYGNLYQYGNNYGFPRGGGTVTDNQTIDCSSYGPGNPYVSNILHQPGYTYDGWYCISPNHNMWGSSGDYFSGYTYTGYNNISPAEDRQGPCPEGYHVPSFGEWLKVFNLVYWEEKETRTEIVYSCEDIPTLPYAQPQGGLPWYVYNAIVSGFKIPITNYDSTELWTSTWDGEYGLKTVMLFNVGSSSPIRYYPNSIRPQETLPLRCFKNEPVIPGTETEVNIHFTISEGNVRIGTATGLGGTLSKNMGTVGVSNSDQILTGLFGANAFWVEDMRGSESGYYTTLSVSDMVGDSNSGHIIGRENVQFKPSGLTKISGAEVGESRVVLGGNGTWNDWTNNTWTGNQTTITYINRQNTSSSEAGKLGKWGDNLQIKITVPAYSIGDIYRGTLTYTLYEL